MVIVTAVFLPRPGEREEVLRVLEATVPSVHREPGCVLYAAHLAEDDDAVLLIEAWESQSHLDAHAVGPAVKEQQLRLAEVLRAPIDVRRYSALPLGDGLRGALLPETH